MHSLNNRFMAEYAIGFTSVPERPRTSGHPRRRPQSDRGNAGAGRAHLLVLLMVAQLLVASCAPSASISESPDTHPTSRRPLPRQEAPPLLLNNSAIRSDILWPALAEAAGGTTLQEYILDQALQTRCAADGITVTSADIQTELELIWQSLDRDRDIAARLLEELKTRKGLGPTRFPALLRRNAMLRAIIRDDVTITEDDLRALYGQQYGTRYMLRIVTCSTRADADDILARARTGESLADLALLHSTDANSAANSGLIGPVSVFDSTYPLGIRQILDDLKPGEPSPILQLESAYAIVGLVHVLQPDESPTFDEAREDLMSLARLRQERILMESLARQLVAECDISIMDPSLGWSWREYRNSQ